MKSVGNASQIRDAVGTSASVIAVKKVLKISTLSSVKTDYYWHDFRKEQYGTGRILLFY